MSRRGATSLAGVLLIDKPSGMTSHDVVAAVRRATGEGRVGHAGTLDPLATGLLVVLVGPYTRLEPYLSGAEKRYEARIALGAETDTDDSEGLVTRTVPVPEESLDPGFAQKALDTLLGPSMQTPPAYSAIKVGGRIAHRAARAGKALDLAARPIVVQRADLLGIDPVGRSWDVRFDVSKGTYIRALARDVGRAIGSAAHLSALRRTGSGSLDVGQALSLDTIVEAGSQGRITEAFHDPVAALGLPAVEGDIRALSVGKAMPLPDSLPARVDLPVAVTVDGVLAGIYRVSGDTLVPEVVIVNRGAA